MDDLVRSSLDEIALEGPNGCSLTRFWSVIDPHYQRYLSHFRIASDAETAPNVPTIKKQVDAHIKAWLWRVVIASPDIEAITSVDGPRQTIDKTTSDFHNLLASASEKNIFLIASQEKRYRVILGEAAINAKLSDATMAVLALIAKCRKAGISQKSIADKTKMDNRTVFYHVRQLLNLNLVVKFPVVTQGAGFLLMVVLKQFHQTDEEEVEEKEEGDIISSTNSKATIDYHACRTQLTKELSLVKGRKMSLRDLRVKLNMTSEYLVRYFKTMVADLTENGFVERIYVKEREEDYDSILCLRLIKMYDPRQEGEQKTESLLSNLDDLSTIPKNLLSGPFVDLPPDQHAYMLAISQGSQGLHSRSFTKALRMPTKLLFQIMASVSDNKSPENYRDSMAKNRCLKSEAVSVGKSRITRYFSSVAPTEQLFFGTEFANIGKIVASDNQMQVTDNIESIAPELPNDVNQVNCSGISNVPLQSLIVPSGTVAENSLSEAVHSPKLPHAAKNPRTSAQSLERRNNLLMLLSERRILEVNESLTNDYMRRFNTDGKGNDFKPARKTLYKLAVSLGQQKEAIFRAVDVNRPLKGDKEGGATVTKYYLVANDADVEAEIQQKVEEFRLTWTSFPMKRKAETEVVLIDDSDEHFASIFKERRLKREQKQRKRLKESAEDDEQDATGTEDLILNSTARKHNDASSRIALEISGLFHGRFIKFKYFHAFLWEFLYAKYGDSDVDWILHPVEVLDSMPLKVYLYTFGHSGGDMSRQEYFDQYGENTLLKDLPEDMLGEVRKSKKRLRRNLISHIMALMALKLVAKMGDETEKIIPSKLLFARQVHVFDWSKEENPPLYSFNLKSIDEVDSYWEVLQMWFVAQKSGDLPFQKNDPLYSGEKSRSWTMWDIPPEQKKVLETHCDRKTGETPYEDIALCHRISEETKLTLPAIRLYYRRILEAFQKPVPRVVTFDPAQRKTRFKKSSDQEDDTSSAMVDMTATQYGSDKKFRSRIRRHWTDEQNKLILVSVVVLNYRVQELGILRNVWPPLACIFPNIPIDVTRRQFNLLLRYDHWSTIHDDLVVKWEQIYHDGIRSGNLEKPKELDVMKFDLKYYVNYFIAHLGSTMENIAPLPDMELPKPIVSCDQPKKTPPLPASMDLFFENYSIETVKSEGDHESLPVDFLDSELTSVTRMALKYAESWCMPAAEPWTQNNDIEDQAKSLVKMVILTDHEEYDVETAHALTSQCDGEVMKQTTEEMKNSGIIVEDRTAATDRRIPGRAMSMSQKNRNGIKNAFPEKFLENAYRAYEKVEIDGSLEVPEAVEDGTMLYVLSARLLEHGTISLRAPKLNDRHRNTVDESDQSADCPIFITPLKEGKSTSEPMAIDMDDDILKQVTKHIIASGPNGTTIQAVSNALRLPVDTISGYLHNLADQSHMIFSSRDHVTHASHVPSKTVVFGDSNRRVPFMWLNIHGSISETILHRCKYLVLSKLVQFPGISSTSLSLHLNKYMTHTEVSDILRRLLVQGRVKVKQTGRRDVYFPSLTFITHQT